ncbi:MAG: endonuclease/exonuclease/phosphatase family protein [Muribaculaceae bacterium]|nr:endonuclease/exonuclease/phosphatase family protein [Muribaculaceae bacterium]
MKIKDLLKASLMLLAGASATFCAYAQPKAQTDEKRYNVFGVAFYNLENLFDTINNNGKYDLEFSPEGKNRWDGNKYWSKIKNLSYAISQMKTENTPMGPAIIGVSEIENRSVLDDLVAADAIKNWNLQVVHHDSPDARGVDVGLLYNPRFFHPINVTNHRLVVPELPNFKTRDQMCVFGLLGGSRVAVIVNHWPSRRGGEKESSWLREAAASLTKQIADSLYQIDPNVGIIVMGDLNDDPHNKSVAETLGAKRNSTDISDHGFYNPFWGMLDQGIGSYIYRGGWDLFDQIIINGNLVKNKGGLEYIQANVFNKPFLLQSDGQYKGYPKRTFSGGVWLDGYSDHLPTIIYLKRER